MRSVDRPFEESKLLGLEIRKAAGRPMLIIEDDKMWSEIAVYCEERRTSRLVIQNVLYSIAKGICCQIRKLCNCRGIETGAWDHRCIPGIGGRLLKRDDRKVNLATV